MNYCICCGEVIPEGTLVCPDCLEKYGEPRQSK